ncbi:hypothetical protein DI392_06260 [Vibrio albus]|uniref:Glycoside hydrolase family 32 protein n=1 Tax=Vibrio albus TaxID=2200953 RepID=A0A2U3BAM0_9VIBR|nr:glycoside hydrolase family 32 protein [Vibrio albus]PWI33803.1 hypothetical protein DI392_06260 [Vibrio albus]
MKIMKDKFTPNIHFKAPFGWLNDPNGLVYANEQWHLLYQFHPMSNIWGPMHWGHAVSDDLVNWIHCPIAIAPDEQGAMFSGSGIIDKNNDSGLFDGPSDNNLVIFYTASLTQAEQDDFQTQCLAYSNDGGLSWTKYEHNPVIANPGLACYRDPKVLWVEESQSWVLLITHGQSIGIYKSTNLTHWELCSEFGESEGLHTSGPWECPDMYPLTAEDGMTKWILVVGIGDGCEASGSGTQYFVGDFDGETFINSNPSEKVLYLDNGRDYYATQSWFNAPDNKRVGISWMSNWRYARDTETQTFRSIMTLPREYSLVTNSHGDYVIAQSFASQVNEKFNQVSTLAESEVNVIQPPSSVYKLKGELDLSEEQTAEITLFGEDKPQVTIEYVNGEIMVSSARSYLGLNEILQKEFPHNYSFSQEHNTSSLDVELIVDNGSVELLVCGGRVSMTQLYFPEKPEGQVSLSHWQNVQFSPYSPQ